MSPQERDEVYRRLEEEAEAAARRADELLRMVIGKQMAAHEEIIQPAPKSAPAVATIPAPVVSRPISARSDSEAMFELLISIAREAQPEVTWKTRRAEAALEALHGATGGAWRYARLRKQRWSIQDRFNREMREIGKACAVCGEHYTPKNSKQYRCSECSRQNLRSARPA